MALVLEDSLRLNGNTNTLQAISLTAIHSCSTLPIKESLSADFLKTQSSSMPTTVHALGFKS
jgi:hypothetical protein